MGLPVPVASIETALERLWRESYEAADAEEGPALTRACQLNLVIVCDGADEAEHATDVAARFSGVRPSRIIMTVVDRHTRSDITATISAHCSVPSATGVPQVCCEQITLTGSSGSIDKLAATALPLLLSDLPVALWNPGDFRPLRTHSGGDLVRSIINAADRVIVDSSRFDKPLDRYRDLATLGPRVADLSWERLRGWRETTASMFDMPSVAWDPSMLEAIDTIEVEYGGVGEASPAEAILLSAWAADRLCWRPSGTFEGTEGGAWVCRSSRATGARARLAVRRNTAEKTPGVSRLLLAGAGYSFSVTREEEGRVKATTLKPGAAPADHIARLVERDKTTLLCRALDGGADQIHEQALRMALMLFNLGPKEPHR